MCEAIATITFNTFLHIDFEMCIFFHMKDEAICLTSKFSNFSVFMINKAMVYKVNIRYLVMFSCGNSIHTNTFATMIDL